MDEIYTAMFANYHTPCFAMGEDTHIIWCNSVAQAPPLSIHIGDRPDFLLQHIDKESLFAQLKTFTPVQIEQTLYPFQNDTISFFPVKSDPLVTMVVLTKRTTRPSLQGSNNMLDAFLDTYKTNITSNDAIYYYIGRKITDMEPWEADSYLQKLVRTNYKILRDTNNVALVSKILTHQLHLKPRLSDIYEFFRTSLDAIDHLIEHIDIPFSYHVPEGSLYTAFDREYLNLVLTNLISNACLYTRDFNTVHVSVTAKQNQIILKVADKGMGIKEAYKSDLLEPYFSCEETTGIKSLGLGLFLCKEVAKQAGGTMLITSEFGEGTTVQFSFPLADGEADTGQLQAKVSDYLQNRFSTLYVGLCQVCAFPFP